MSTGQLISREEVLGGMPAKQASALLFAIESRTAYLVEQSRQAMALYLTDAAVEARNRTFLQAIAHGAKLPLQPSIQDVERFAPHWAALVPDNPKLRAAVLHRLGRKYNLAYAAMSNIRAALGVDQPAVAQAYQTLYNQPIESVFAARMTPTDRLRWLWSGVAVRLESLPAFWTAFALTLTETVGAGILALPIALAGVGPLPALAILLVLGLVNVLTIAAIAEAVARNGHVRYGHTYFGRLVADYLGGAGSAIFTFALLIFASLALVIYYLGLGSTLANATGVPAGVWAAVLFCVGLYVLSRKTLSSTVASALIVGAINITLILVLSGLALTKMQGVHLAYVHLPGIAGHPFDASILGSVFGVVLLAYFGHMSTGNCARVVLRRDPSARSLIWGCVAATVAALGLYSVWVLTVNSAVAPQTLLRESGTALAPLAERVGPSVHLFGSIFVALSMGIASLHMSLSLFYLVGERLPSATAAASTALNDRRRFWLCASPVVLIFLLVEWLLITGNVSFTKPLSFAGTITATLIGGIFPILMLVASRRQGEYMPGLVFRVLGHRAVVAMLYLGFLSSLLLHGLVIWQNLLERLVAIAISALIVGATVVMVRRGCFKPRLVVELREQDRRAGVAITDTGRPAHATMQLTYADGEQQFEAAAGEIPRFATLKSLVIDLPTTAATELKVWAHRVTPQGESVGLPVRLTLHANAAEQSPARFVAGDGAAYVESQASEALLATGQALLPLAAGVSRLELTFHPQER